MQLSTGWIYLSFDLIKLFLTAVLLWPTTALAELENTTYDDASGLFTWTGEWNAASPSWPCPDCLWQPDRSQLYNATWHDGGSDGGASGRIQFSGAFKLTTVPSTFSN